jgi:hypothetical protein
VHFVPIDPARTIEEQVRGGAAATFPSLFFSTRSLHGTGAHRSSSSIFHDVTRLCSDTRDANPRALHAFSLSPSLDRA